MGISADLRALRIRRTSDDGNVTVELDERGGIVVAIEPRRDRPVRTLSTSIGDTVSRALTGYLDERERVIADARQGRPAHPQRPEHRRFAEAVDRLGTRASSPRGKVHVRWTGQSRIDIHIDQSTVIAHESLIYEVNAALAEVVARRTHQIGRLHRKLYDPEKA